MLSLCACGGSSTTAGAGCAGYAAKVPSGAGAVSGMALDPVAVAASNNPALTTLTAAVSGKLSPDKIVGTHKTVRGGSVPITGSKDALKVDDAGVVCGGVLTANSTVYMVDSVLMPK